MAYAYADWATKATAAERETALRAHVAEVAAAVRPDVQAGGTSVNRQALQEYHATLLRELREVAKEAAAERRGGVMVTRGRPV